MFFGKISGAICMYTARPGSNAKGPQMASSRPAGVEGFVGVVRVEQTARCFCSTTHISS